MNSTATATAAIAAICATPLLAHHSISTIDISTPVWVKGTVVRYEAVNPHTMIELDESTADGQVRRWTIEGPIPSRLDRYGLDKDFLKAGDVIDVCGFAPKRSGAKPPSPRFVHGHLLVLQSGRMQLWGPYGKLDNCVRRADEAQAWADFLDMSPMARQMWCNEFTASFSLSPLSSKALVAEVDRLTTEPCH